LNEIGFLVLKGRYILAQGKRRRSAALGWWARIRVVREIMFFNAKILFRTREMTLCFPEMVSCNSVRKGLLGLFIESRGRFFSRIFTQGGVSVRSSLNCALG